MRNFLALLFLFITLPSFAGGNVTFDLRKWFGPDGQNKLANVEIKLEPTKPATAGALFPGDRYSFRTDSNGTYVVTNMAPAEYSVDVVGPFKGSRFSISVTNCDGCSMNAHELVTTASTPVQSAEVWAASRFSSKTNPTIRVKGTGYDFDVTPAQLAKLKYLQINVCAPPYNAQPNTNTDSTVAFQNAINDAFAATTGNGSGSARGGVVYIPPGNYKISDTLEMRAGVMLYGASRESVMLHTWCSGKPGIVYDDGAENLSNASLYLGNFSMLNHVTDSGPAMRLDGTFGQVWWGGSAFFLNNITVYDYTSNGIESWGNMDSVWHGVKAVRAGQNGFYFSTNSFNTSSSFHLSSLACGEFGMRGVASYSEFSGSADANKFGGWRFDTGTALRFYGGGEFNFSNQVDAQYVFGMNIQGGVFLTLHTNTVSALKFDTCHGVTISGTDIGGGSGGLPTNGVGPIVFNNSSGAYVQGNTYWAKWNGTNYIVGDGGWMEGVNYRKTVARDVYVHRMESDTWELNSANPKIKLNTIGDTTAQFVLASQGVEKMSLKKEATTHDLSLYSYTANSNAMTIKNDGSIIQNHWPTEFRRGILIGTNAAQAQPLYVKGNSKFVVDNSFLMVDTLSETGSEIMMMNQGVSKWGFKVEPITHSLIFLSYDAYRHYTGLGETFLPAYNKSFPFLIDGQNRNFTLSWPAKITNGLSIKGQNAAVNYVWTCTNATTGEGEWRSVGSVSGTVTTADLNVSSNAVYAAGVSYTLGASNALQAQISGGGVSLSALQSATNDSYGYTRTYSAATSNALQTAIGNKQEASANLSAWSGVSTSLFTRVTDLLSSSNYLQSAITALEDFQGASTTDLQAATNTVTTNLSAQIQAATNTSTSAIVSLISASIAASQITIPTNILTCADHVFMDVNTNAAGFQHLYLDRAAVTLHSTNRNVRAGDSVYNLTIYGQAASATSVTCDGNWVVFGTNRVFNVPAGSRVTMPVRFGGGQNETNITVIYSVL